MAGTGPPPFADAGQPTRIALRLAPEAGRLTIPLAQLSERAARALLPILTASGGIILADPTGSPGVVTVELQRPVVVHLPKVAVGDGIYLEAAMGRVDGRRVGLPLTLVPGAAREVELVLVPSFRVVVEGHGSFGGGVYRWGALARIGVRDDEGLGDGLLGVLGGVGHFVGWTGVPGSTRSLDLTITEPLVATARFAADPLGPALAMGLVALLLLAARPDIAPWWAAVELGRKAL